MTAWSKANQGGTPRWCRGRAGWVKRERIVVASLLLHPPPPPPPSPAPSLSRPPYRIAADMGLNLLPRPAPLPPPCIAFSPDLAGATDCAAVTGRGHTQLGYGSGRSVAAWSPIAMVRQLRNFWFLRFPIPFRSDFRFPISVLFFLFQCPSTP